MALYCSTILATIFWREPHLVADCVTSLCGGKLSSSWAVAMSLFFFSWRRKRQPEYFFFYTAPWLVPLSWPSPLSLRGKRGRKIEMLNKNISEQWESTTDNIVQLSTICLKTYEHMYHKYINQYLHIFQFHIELNHACNQYLTFTYKGLE